MLILQMKSVVLFVQQLKNYTAKKFLKLFVFNTVVLLNQKIFEYMAKENVDGALVGGASLEADSFLALLDAVK